MEQKGSNKSNHTPVANNTVISSDILNKCISGRRGGRLGSIIPSRLLTAGGTKKRVFLPNIPIKQEKSKDDIPQEKSKRHENREHGHKFQDRGRGRGRGRGELLQLKGSVFEGRTSERIVVKKEFAPRFGERSGGGNVMEMPKYTPVSGTKSDDEEENEALKKLFKDDFLDDEDDDDDDFIPVKLPLAIKAKVKKEEIKPDMLKIKIKQEPDDDMNIKEEMMDEDMDFKNEMDIKKERDIKNIKAEVKTEHENEAKSEPFSDLFTNNSIHESGELLFFHFPDCLPRNCIADEDDEAEKSTQDDSDNCQHESKWSLKDVPEGSVGKLQVLKSGRVRLKIGALYFDVMEGSNLGFLQQIVSLKMTEQSGDLCVLGHIKSKIVCFPTIENLTNYNYA